MSRYRFDPADVRDAPEAWRPLDRAVAAWVRCHGGSELLARLAGWASCAEGEGDTALDLQAPRAGLAPLSFEALQGLRAEPMLGDGSGAVPTPFVLDAAGRFYLGRNHAQECAVAEALTARRRARLPSALDAAALDALFDGRDDAPVQAQRAAVAAVAGCRLFLLTGGPGTGKTSTVLRMLLALQAGAGRALAIRVAAPTGKAAQRLVQSLREGKRSLAATLPAAWTPWLAAVPEDEALTLHRLLGFDPRRNVFRRHAGQPLAADVVVVDEASMVDLGLLHALLDALPPEACLILLGDADQLASVAAGSVLMDLVEVLEGEAAPDLVRLRHSFRAVHPLVAINDEVRAGDAGAFDAAWQAAGARARRAPLTTTAALQAELARWAARLAAHPPPPVLPARLAPAHAGAAAVECQRAELARAALAGLRRQQLLCALREERFGALAADAAIEREFRRLRGVPAQEHWYHGRPVMVVRNDHAAGLFNGDVGLCLADAEGRRLVWFERPGEPGAQAFAPGALPAHEGAFAITVHKSQGSEYDHVALLLPPDPDTRVLSRQLLYTGLSRARDSLELWAGEASLQAALARVVRRSGGLAERMRVRSV